MIFQNGCSKDHILFQKKKKGKDSSSTERCKCIEARSLESASKWLKIIKLRSTRRAKGPKSSFNQEMKDQKKKKRKLAKLKTQKGGLGKS